MSIKPQGQNIDPAQEAFHIIPSDTERFNPPIRAIYVGGAGDLRFRSLNENIVTLTGVTAGLIYPVFAVQVMSTGTTATSLVGMR
jgi:hypothetical protein